MNKNLNIMITGGTGSFGYQAVNEILKKKNIAKVIIYSRDEFKQSEMSNHFHKYRMNLTLYHIDILKQHLKYLVLPQ